MNKNLQVPDLYGNKLNLWTLDFETFYDTKEKYSLRNKKSTTVQYVRNPLFKAHGCAVIEPDGNKYWVTHDDLDNFFNDRDWSKIAFSAFNCAFDAIIAHERYGVKAAYYVDPLSMARGLWGPGVRNGLEFVSKRLGRAGKIKGELEKTDGVYDLSLEQEASLIPYAIQDAEECRGVFEHMYFDMGFPDLEMHIIDITLKAFVNPKLEIEAGLCKAEITEEDIRMKNLLSSDLIKDAELSAICKDKFLKEGIEGLMRSRPCFAELLLSRGVYPPMKQRMKNGEPVVGEMTYAFAKNDIELISLSDDSRVSDLVAAWTGSKSTLRKTRAQRLLDVTEYGTKPLPIPLNYCGGRTHRWSGGGGEEGVYNPYNPQNLNSGRDGRGSRLREAIIAPKGMRIISCDSAQVECFGGSVQILTRDRGYVTITNITTDDLLWDGHEWVTHDGVIFKGYREVIEYAGIVATPDHIVYLARGGTCTFAQAKMEKMELLVGEREGQAVWTLDHIGSSYKSGERQSVPLGTMSKMWNNQRSFSARFKDWKIGKLLWVHTLQRILQNFAKASSEAATRTVQSNNYVYQPQQQSFCPSESLSRAWHQKLIYQLRRICTLYLRELSKGGLLWFGNRPYRQSWALCSGEYQTFYSGRECSKSRMQYKSSMGWTNNKCSKILAGFKITVPCVNSTKMAQKGSNTSRANSDIRPVYDILNAGPRNRFTAEGYIVSNCRFIAWLGGEQELLDDFKYDRDPYSKLASEIFGVSVSKHNENNHLRHVGKEGELSLGFGVGWKKFFSTIQTKYGLDASIFSEEDAQKVVSYYREKRKGIVQLWKDIDSHLVHMASKTCGKGRPDKVFIFKDDRVVMPNGLSIHYPNFHWRYDSETRQGNYVYQFKDEWVKLYSAKACIAKGTLVKTNRGNIPIEQVTNNHLVWDGEAWVKTQGNVYKGIRFVIKCFAAYMTPDHLVLTTKGWKKAIYAKFWGKKETFTQKHQKKTTGGLCRKKS